MVTISKSYAVKNLDNKRVCDISDDDRTVVIKLKDCATTIRANPDGTLRVSHKYIINPKRLKV